MILGRPAPPGHVALVHHDAARAQDLARQLRTSGHRVSVVDPGRRTVQAIIDSAPDVLIGPLALADPPFAAVVRGVRQALGVELPVLALLSDADPQVLVEADDVIREPIDPGELDLRVGLILRAGQERRVLQRKVQDLLGLYKISWAFSLTGGPEALHGHLARHSAELLKAEKAMVALFDADRRLLVGQHPAHGLTRAQVDAVRYSVDEARQRWNFRTNGPLISNKPQADSRLLPELVAPLDLHSLMLVPLIGVGTRTFHGALLVADRVGGAGFSEDDLNLLIAVAGQATIAVENLKLHGEIQRKNALLEDYDRAKSEFVAIVAHDFRKPLMAIRGFAEMVLEEPDLPAEARQEFMRTVVEETEHLAALANDTLLITRLETGDLEYSFSELDLGPFLLDCVPLGLSNHSVLLDVPSDFPRIVADPDRLRQVIGNLTSNAVKYSPEGGSIILRGRLRGGEHAVIEIIDHGLGIPEDQIDKLFHKFVRVRSEAHMAISGTGLGLYIARKIVEGHGGRIWVESELGRGSTFGLVLPLNARRAARSAAAVAKAATAVAKEAMA